jgi:type I restriction enzyme, S subunit
VKYQDCLLMNNETKHKIVPELRFLEFKDSEEWTETTLGNICSNIASGKDKIDATGQFDLFGSTGIIGKTNDYSYDGNFILVARVGANAGLLTRPNGKFGVTDNTLVVSLKDSENIDFTYYTLERFGLNTLVFGSGQPLITGGQLKNLVIYSPKPHEQQKIADCLSSLDDFITAQNQKLETLRAHKKGLMQQLFPAEGETVPRLRFAEFRDSGEWKIERLSNVAENLDSRRVPITENVREKGVVPYYGASGIIDYVKDFIYDQELLCISEDGANLIDRTYPIAFSISGKTWVNNHAHVLKFEKKFTQVIIENYLNSISLENFLTGAAQPKLNRSKMDEIPIPLPSPDEQQKIAECLSSLDELITTQTEKIEVLKLHKKGLMHGLFPS